MENIKEQFYLNPEVTFLNHGSFGACPKPVLENYQSWQRALEAEPIQFLTKRYYESLPDSKKLFAKYIVCDHD